ncbi:DNA cytosine methyltransferase [Aeromonas hydrophila]|uniref:DNA cytosine methyltransferase n=1 Tax=Aeromonas hydrophila TaxID=644 RepID=UPI00256E9EC5|nr:DNA cytosine methyltransferase [Aeromonas hydrophila]MDL5384984.1 DNA cytosine methyltransferase [Aeromonas hydrophila]
MNSFASPIPIVDLFAGPGGLGEGFSSLHDGSSFQIKVSAEKDPIARKTLRLRAYYRLLKSQFREGLEDYYLFCNGKSQLPYTEKTKAFWDKANTEAMCIAIGSPEGNCRLDAEITNALAQKDKNLPWVLIGGPPCQAYSIAGRSRNKGIADYKPENDQRHFLYLEYLRIIQNNRPDIFVMENVKGILSSKVNGDYIFHQILRDLANPNIALNKADNNLQYNIVSLVCDEVFKDGDDPENIDSSKFIIRAEEYGIPQSRHRVILLGIRSDHFKEGLILPKLASKPPITVKSVIGKLPRLRSKLSRGNDSPDAWEKQIKEGLKELANDAIKVGLAQNFVDAIRKTAGMLSYVETGALRYPKESNEGCTGSSDLNEWFRDDNLKVWLNHETRGHRIDDLIRYGFAACFAETQGRSPKGHKEFCLKSLAPAHKNWESGHFSDRFRVQLANSPSTTITSHISKDGHYFIHFDPRQCRSLTVREAARLQTFPDNYFFEGGRTQQYHQVGNAVPPLLAQKIASLVLDILKKTHSFDGEGR